MADRTIIEPVPSPDSAPFWSAAAEGRLTLRECSACGRAHWYPRPTCPFCFSADTVWREASGRGEIYSYSVMRRVPAPYAIAYVRLEEGPIMMTNIVAPDLDALAIGQAVSVAFVATPGGFHLPCFRISAP